MKNSSLLRGLVLQYLVHSSLITNSKLKVQAMILVEIHLNHWSRIFKYYNYQVYYCILLVYYDKKLHVWKKTHVVVLRSRLGLNLTFGTSRSPSPSSFLEVSEFHCSAISHRGSNPWHWAKQPMWLQQLLKSLEYSDRRASKDSLRVYLDWRCLWLPVGELRWHLEARRR